MRELDCFIVACLHGRQRNLVRPDSSLTVSKNKQLAMISVDLDVFQIHLLDTVTSLFQQHKLVLWGHLYIKDYKDWKLYLYEGLFVKYQAPSSSWLYLCSSGRRPKLDVICIELQKGPVLPSGEHMV